MPSVALPPEIRAKLYLGFAVVGVALGAIQVGYGAASVDQPTWLTVTAERAVSRAMGGSCSMPLAAHGQWLADGTLQLRAAWGDLETGAALVRAEDTARVHTLGEADALGLAVAARLRAHGARAANA